MWRWRERSSRLAAELVHAQAPAKVNLSLAVRSPDASGLHPLRSLVQTFDWCDELNVALADEDTLEMGDAQLPEGGDNLIWQAVEAVRRRSRDRRPFSIELTKRIPVAAGLAGGSADAAAALLAAGRLLGLPPTTAADLAPSIGGDVLFSLQGGFAWMEGHGEQLTALTPVPDDYALAVVVPPIWLTTATVYRRWDEMGGPAGDPIGERHLPPSLRPFAPLVNDLYPAALELQPDLGDWRAELADRWDRPVMLSGSGPSLFGYFADFDEAGEAVTAAPREARSSCAVRPIGDGARLVQQ